MIAQYDPDLILAVDDNAQHFLAKKHLDTGVNIVFAGVNGEVDRYNYIGKKNVTGIFERKSILGISFVLNALNEYNHTEDKKNITLLLDSSNSSKQDKNHLTQRDWGDFNFNIRQVETFAQWQQFIHSLARNKVDYLLVSGYRKLQTANDPNQYVDYKTVVEWTQAHSSVPIIALNIFSAQDGFALAVGSSPFEQANVSLEIIDKILIKKMTPKDIAFVTPHLYSIGINKTALKKAKYKLPVFIESFAEGTDNVYE
ncbi:ABC-type sugar transport system, ATPase component [uncultured Candidatus Thioglobus sp.]|nr:ABC-type sugar transport system, ATPase component [uncultured Candidatus Thioglobus sp.]